VTGATRRRVALLALVVAVSGLLVLALAGPGSRLGLWHWRTGLGLLRWAAHLGVAGSALGVVAGLLRGPKAICGPAVALGLAAVAAPWQFQRQARAVPPIHDISTDTQDPPAFVAVTPLRKDASNPPEYAGPEVAAQQQRAYPDLRSLVLPIPPAEAFARAEGAARALGWEIVAAVAQEGRLEATDTTFWFGFKDDVVVRVRPDPAGSRVDVRSKSRVGRSDVGANARRIRRLLDGLR
jgi:uncharacterized protein (DUF1499 family)